MAIPRLRFNYKSAFIGYMAAVNNAADELIDSFYTEVKNGLRSNAKSDVQKMSEREERMIRKKVIGYADAIMDSYGTGSEMDTTNPFFVKYRRSALWNRGRRFLEIAGRSKGFYTDIYGKRRFSTGRRYAVNIEDYYEPIEPSYAFQRAEAWMTDKRIAEVLNKHIREWMNGAYKYFVYR